LLRALLKYTAVGMGFGLSLAIIIYLLYDSNLEILYAYAPPMALVGSFVGAGFATFQFFSSPTPQPFKKRRNLVIYYPARCASCHGRGKGRFFKCQAWGGRGSVLVVDKSPRCPACRGTGKTMFILHCKTCNGSGWAHSNLDNM
jgi:hypothetical protein